jgi:hypothetical protein
MLAMMIDDIAPPRDRALDVRYNIHYYGTKVNISGIPI